MVVTGQATDPQEGESQNRNASLPGSQLRVFLLTFGQGDAIWELFGHNAIWIQDAADSLDVAYNWGIMDPGQGDFILRFLKGRMLYSMEGGLAERMVGAYRYYNRSVWFQELNLTPDQRLELKQLIEVNARPENRQYLYDYFLDNCSTRPRDLLDRVLGGQIRAATAELPAGSYRFHTRRLTQHDLFAWVGIDLLLGNRGDRAISRWEAMFVPKELQTALRDVTVVDGSGRESSLVLREQTVFTAAREPPPETPAGFRWLFLVGGLVTGGVLAGLGSWRRRGQHVVRRGLALIAVGWSLLSGLLGLILLFVLLTDHVFMYWNENILQYNPLSLTLSVAMLVFLFRQRLPRWAPAVALSVAVLSALGLAAQLLPGFDQGNGEHVALALPIHAALAYALVHLRAERQGQSADTGR